MIAASLGIVTPFCSCSAVPLFIGFVQAGGAGARLELVIRKDIDAPDIPHAETPLVLHEGKLIFSGLPRTEEIETWLLSVCAARNQATPYPQQEQA